MPRFALVLASLAVGLVGCGAPIEYCGRGCTPKGVHHGTNGPANAEGGPLVANCGVGFTCNADTSTCMANDGHCATGGGTGGSSSTSTGSDSASGTSGGSGGGTSSSTGGETSSGTGG